MKKFVIGAICLILIVVIGEVTGWYIIPENIKISIAVGMGLVGVGAMIFFALQPPLENEEVATPSSFEGFHEL